MIDSVRVKLMYIRFSVFLAVLFGGTHSLAADVLYSVTDLGSLGGSYTEALSPSSLAFVGAAVLLLIGAICARRRHSNRIGS